MFNPTRRSVLAATAAGAAVAGLAACSNDNSKGSGAAKADFEERGPISVVRGKDNTGKFQEFIKQWNDKHPDEKVTLIELPESADEQRS